MTQQSLDYILDCTNIGRWPGGDVGDGKPPVELRVVLTIALDLSRRGKRISAYFDATTRHYIVADVERAIYERMLKQFNTVFYQAPKGVEADEPILAMADIFPDAFIITNDCYLKYMPKYPWLADTGSDKRSRRLIPGIAQAGSEIVLIENHGLRSAWGRNAEEMFAELAGRLSNARDDRRRSGWGTTTGPGPDSGAVRGEGKPASWRGLAAAFVVALLSLGVVVGTSSTSDRPGADTPGQQVISVPVQPSLSAGVAGSSEQYGSAQPSDMSVAAPIEPIPAPIEPTPEVLQAPAAEESPAPAQTDGATKSSLRSAAGRCSLRDVRTGQYHIPPDDWSGTCEGFAVAKARELGYASAIDRRTGAHVPTNDQGESPGTPAVNDLLGCRAVAIGHGITRCQ